MTCCNDGHSRITLRRALSGPRNTQVKMAEHALTGHKVAIKILNRKKIKAMDMDEKGTSQT